jgi:hypothetical protein
MNLFPLILMRLFILLMGIFILLAELKLLNDIEPYYRQDSIELNGG